MRWAFNDHEFCASGLAQTGNFLNISVITSQAIKIVGRFLWSALAMTSQIMFETGTNYMRETPSKLRTTPYLGLQASAKNKLKIDVGRGGRYVILVNSTERCRQWRTWGGGGSEGPKYAAHCTVDACAMMRVWAHPERWQRWEVAGAAAPFSIPIVL